jgi:hypothetical protein
MALDSSVSPAWNLLSRAGRRAGAVSIANDAKCDPPHAVVQLLNTAPAP